MRAQDQKLPMGLEVPSHASGRPRLADRLPVLLYHSISRIPGRSPFEYLVIPPEKFEAQIRGLSRRGYNSIRAIDITRWQREGVPLPKKSVLITFDDGFEETAERAFPVLRRYGFTATMFLITGLCDADRSFEGRRVMTPEQIRYWAQEGIEFGSHTRTHRDLTTLDAAALESEIAESVDDLRAILGAPVESFAYPYGRFSDSARRAAGRVFGAAFTCEDGMNDRTTNSLLLRRTIVSPTDTLPEFFARLWFGRNRLQRLFKPYRVWRRLSDSVAARFTAGSAWPSGRSTQEG
jgi:hypothetical protein